MPSEQPRKRGKLLRMPKPRTLVQKRLLDAADLLRNDEAEVTFQHSVFCQVSLPYRDPSSDVRVWTREQGQVSIRIEAGHVKGHRPGEWLPIGLPFGPKPRLIMAYLNGEALRTKSPEIETDATLTAFVKRLLGYDPNGFEIRSFRDQLGRLSAANFRIAMVSAEDRMRLVQTHIVSEFEIWGSDERQRVLWPSVVRLSWEYYDSLTRHAVPLDERAIGALSHSAMALDLYAWLAQRLHRIPKPHRQLVPWVSLKEQFGHGYGAMFKFRQVFLQALRQVLVGYEAAKIEVNGKGLVLHTSPPPVAKTGVVVQLPPPSAS
jgi:Plasmid encoded RepA protein